MNSETFVLGDEALNNSKKSLNALRSNDQESIIYLIINVKKKLIRSKDYIQRIIPISNKINALTNKSVLLITKDDQSYKSELLKDELTQDIFNDIIPIRRLKKKNKKELVKLFKESDYIIADHRVNKFLPNILGSIFYHKNKKLPYILQMARPTTDKSKLRISKENKLKDDRCEVKYVYKQIKSIVENTSYLPTDGDCLCIKIGMTNVSTNKIIENINDVINYLLDEKNLPNGGVLTLNQLGNIYVKTSESISLPISIKEETTEINEEDEANSDYDF
ncbi:unnamed protein product [Candida verbasci]|uniref:Uncharacterized protein n=1 Tax=Candida verbasci TaxID=1227364 RepID=A0A9W4XGG3_9ASCO|nr:unnamed protein product [Candida verbasci]